MNKKKDIKKIIIRVLVTLLSAEIIFAIIIGMCMAYIVGRIGRGILLHRGYPVIQENKLTSYPTYTHKDVNKRHNSTMGRQASRRKKI